MSYKAALAVLGSTLMMSSSAFAEMKWSSFSLSYLQGSNYEAGDDTRQVLTVEHASGHSWGDNFFFIDHLTFDDGTIDNYFELSPRVSFSSLFSSDLSVGPIKDFYFAATWEGSGGFDNYLYGLGMGVDIPGFKYFNVNVFTAKNELWEDDEQLTLTWGLPFNLGSAEFLYDGFLDYSTSQEGREAEMNFTSQLKWNLGKTVGMKSPLYLGIEYAYWDNKFGVADFDERNPCLLVKWHF